MQTYTTRSNARRAAVSKLVKTAGKDAAAIRKAIGDLELVSQGAEGFCITGFDAAMALIDPIKQGKAKRKKGAVAQVWDICSRLQAEGKSFSRKDWMDECVLAGINYFTARTQVQAFKKAARL